MVLFNAQCVALQAVLSPLLGKQLCVFRPSAIKGDPSTEVTCGNKCASGVGREEGRGGELVGNFSNKSQVRGLRVIKARHASLVWATEEKGMVSTLTNKESD